MWLHVAQMTTSEKAIKFFCRLISCTEQRIFNNVNCIVHILSFIYGTEILFKMLD